MYYFIEQMTAMDIPRVQAIERRSFSTPWSATTYQNELRNTSTSRYIVARSSTSMPPARNAPKPVRRSFFENLLSLWRQQDNPHDLYPIIGYGGVWLSVDEGHITTIATDPEHRGCGVGELLLNGLIDQALDLGADMLTLEVRVSNLVAQQLYLKYGFRAAGKRPRYYTDNGEDALIMWTEALRTSSYQEQLQGLREKLYVRLRQHADSPPSPRPRPTLHPSEATK